MGQKRLSSGRKGTQATQSQWQPTLTAHDPNPPITLEDGVVAVPLVLVAVDAEHWESEEHHEEERSGQVFEAVAAVVDPIFGALDPEAELEGDVADEQWLPQPQLEDVVGPVFVDEQEIEELEEAFAASQHVDVAVADFIAPVQDPDGDAGAGEEADGDEMTSTGSGPFEDAPAPAAPESDWIIRARRRGRR